MATIVTSSPMPLKMTIAFSDSTSISVPVTRELLELKLSFSTPSASKKQVTHELIIKRQTTACELDHMRGYSSFTL